MRLSLTRLLLGVGGVLVLSTGASAQGIIGNFPSPVHPAGNQTSPAKVALGQILFWDEQLSSDNTMACGTCHFPESGGNDAHAGAPHPGADGIFGTADDLFGSPGMIRQDVNGEYADDVNFGVGRQATERNAPTMINSAFFDALFWDLRADASFEFENGNVVPGMGMNAGLESQAVEPPVSSVEMAHDMIQWSDITSKLDSVEPLALATNIPGNLAIRIANANNRYRRLFTQAFGPTPVQIGMQPRIITRERVAKALASYMRSLVSDQSPFDLGMMSQDAQDGQVIFQQNGCTGCHSISNGVLSNGIDFNINLPNHSRSVKTPTLRNMALRKRFMHSGQFSTLDEIMAFYNQEIPNTNPSFPFAPPLSQDDKDKVIAFFEALTDPRVENAQAPFDRPRLHSEDVPFGSNIYGASSSGSGGQHPIMIANSPANAGNVDFKIGIGNGLGSAAAVLGLSLARTAPGTISRGIPLHIDLSPGVLIQLTSLNLDGLGAGNGVGTMRLPAFASAALVGTTLFAQWFVVDPAGPQGFVGTSGAEITVF